MADGRDDVHLDGPRPAYLWTEIFRCFQVALGPSKLLAAAAGILGVSLGWYALSLIFGGGPPPAKTAPEYSDPTVLQRKYEKLPPDQQRVEGEREFERDLARWQLLESLAGEGGRLRTLPWYEYRGPNPYLFASGILSGTPDDRRELVSDFASSTVPVLVEPLVKLLVPVAKIADPAAGPLTRLYLALCILWSLAVWAFFAGVITRIAAVQLTGRDRVSFGQAVRFVADRYLSYLLSPLVPLTIIAAVTVGLIVFALLALIPVVGDVVFYGVGLPLVIAGGVVMTILLIGLVGYPLMYATLSVEGSDTFDALSRSYNYVFQCPWQYAWYSLVAVVYGSVVTFFVVFAVSLTVYLGKWAITSAPLTETTNQKPDYLFLWAPESFGWKELMLRGTPIERTAKTTAVDGRKVVRYEDTDPARAEAYKKTYQAWNWVGTSFATFWLTLAFLLMLGFSYSFYWTAATMIYLLMRKKVDEVELDEIYLDDEPEPVAPVPAPVAESKPGAVTLPTVPPPATVPFTPPPAVSVPSATTTTTTITPSATMTPVSPPAAPISPTPMPETRPADEDGEKE